MGLDDTDAGSRTSDQASHVNDRNPRTSAIIYYLPEFIIRKVNVEGLGLKSS